MPDGTPHQPTDKTRAEVQALASFGVPQGDIARYIGIAERTLRKHYRDELDLAEVKANAQVGRFLFGVASGQALKQGATYADCTRAAMFWAKTRMRWRETDRLELTGQDGGPIDTITRRIVDPKRDAD